MKIGLMILALLSLIATAAAQSGDMDIATASMELKPLRNRQLSQPIGTIRHGSGTP